MELKDKFKQALEQIKKKDESYEIKFFESADELQFLETTAGDGDSTNDEIFGKSPKRHDSPQPVDEEPEIDTEDEMPHSGGDGEDEGGDDDGDEGGGGGDGADVDGDGGDGDDEGDGEGGEGDDDDDGGDDEEKKKLKVGDRVRVKATGREGIVTSINEDGTYVVSELFSSGGGITTIVEFAEGGLVNLPSTDPRTWGEVYNKGDKVKIRVDFRTNERDRIYTVEEIQVALGDYSSGKGAQRPENPSGRMYILTDGGGTWEGKDLVLIEKNQSTSNALGDYEEDELEKIKPPKPPKDPRPTPTPSTPPPPPPPPPPLTPEQIDEYRLRLNNLKNKKFKFPSLAKMICNANLDNDLFYMEQARLAFYFSCAKEVLKPIKPMMPENARTFYDFKYSLHIAFLRINLTADFKLKTDTPIVYFERKKPAGGRRNQNQNVDQNPSRVETYSIDRFEQNLENLSEAKIKKFLGVLERYITQDDYIYRIISLISVLKPEFFDKNFLKEHFWFLCSYFSVRNFSFTNVPDLVFGGVAVTEQILFEKVQSPSLIGNLDLYDITVSENDFIVYVVRNIRNKSGNIDRVSVSKMNVLDLPDMDRQNIVQNMLKFYEYSPSLQNNQTIKSLCYKNLENLSILHKEIYSVFLTDFILSLANIKPK